MVLYGFLRDSRATAIIAVSIPVSVIGTFLLMYSNDVSLNIMSLGGIALAVGMLVDNAIVVLENIVRKREQGEGILEAARNGTAEVSTAVIAAQLMTRSGAKSVMNDKTDAKQKVHDAYMKALCRPPTPIESERLAFMLTDADDADKSRKRYYAGN